MRSTPLIEEAPTSTSRSSWATSSASMPEWRLIHAPGSWALHTQGVSARRWRARSRAALTRCLIVSESRVLHEAMSARVGVCTSMRMSIRSRRGPDKRSR